MVNSNFILLSIFVLFIAIIISNWESIRKFFANVIFGKHVNEAEYQYVCPRCGSTNLKNIFLMSPVELARPGARKLNESKYRLKYGTLLATIGPSAYFGLAFWQPKNPEVYICLDCDYNGICPQVEADKIEEFKKKLIPS